MRDLKVTGVIVGKPGAYYVEFPDLFTKAGPYVTLPEARNRPPLDVYKFEEMVRLEENLSAEDEILASLPSYKKVVASVTFTVKEVG